MHVIDNKIQVPSKQNIKDALAPLKIHFVNIVPLEKEGYIVFADHLSDLEAIQTGKGYAALKAINLKPAIPANLNAEKTLVVKNLEARLGRKSVKEIAETVKQTLPQVKAVFKTNAIRVIKILLPTVADANHLLAKGFVLGGQRIPPNNLEKELFIRVNTCFRCYEVEKHLTKHCQANKQWCSTCAKSGHEWKTCKAPPAARRCLNCQRENREAMSRLHHTMAWNCPTRKRELAAKRSKALEQLRNPPPKQRRTVPGATNIALLPTPTSTQPTLSPRTRVNSSVLSNQSYAGAVRDPIDRDSQLKVQVLIQDAHLAAACDGSRTYSSILGESIKTNFGVELKFPEHNSKKIASALRASAAAMVLQPPYAPNPPPSSQTRQSNSPPASVAIPTSQKPAHSTSPSQAPDASTATDSSTLRTLLFLNSTVRTPNPTPPSPSPPNKQEASKSTASRPRSQAVGASKAEYTSRTFTRSPAGSTPSQTPGPPNRDRQHSLGTRVIHSTARRVPQLTTLATPDAGDLSKLPPLQAHKKNTTNKGKKSTPLKTRKPVAPPEVSLRNAEANFSKATGSDGDSNIPECSPLDTNWRGDPNMFASEIAKLKKHPLKQAGPFKCCSFPFKCCTEQPNTATRKKRRKRRKNKSKDVNRDTVVPNKSPTTETQGSQSPKPPSANKSKADKWKPSPLVEAPTDVSTPTETSTSKEDSGLQTGKAQDASQDESSQAPKAATTQATNPALIPQSQGKSTLAAPTTPDAVTTDTGESSFNFSKATVDYERSISPSLKSSQSDSSLPDIEEGMRFSPSSSVKEKAKQWETGTPPPSPTEPPATQQLLSNLYNESSASEASDSQSFGKKCPRRSTPTPDTVAAGLIEKKLKDFFKQAGSPVSTILEEDDENMSFHDAQDELAYQHQSPEPDRSRHYDPDRDVSLRPTQDTETFTKKPCQGQTGDSSPLETSSEEDVPLTPGTQPTPLAPSRPGEVSASTRSLIIDTDADSVETSPPRYQTRSRSKNISSMSAILRNNSRP